MHTERQRRAALFGLVLLISLARSIHAVDKEPVSTVIAEGTGKDLKEAKKAAFRDAVRKVVGVLIDAETLVKNDEVISEQIYEYSGGFIQTFEVLSEKKIEGGLIRIQIKAVVERLHVLNKLKTAKVKVTTSEVRGEDLLAEKMTQEEARKNATRLLQQTFKELPLLFEAKLEGKPRLNEQAGGVVLVYNVSVNAEKYQAFVKKAVVVLDKIAVGMDTVTLSARPRNNPTPGLYFEDPRSPTVLINPPLPKGQARERWAVWVMTSLDRSGQKSRWNLYWLDTEVAESLEPVLGEPTFHASLEDRKGELIAEEEFALFPSQRGVYSGGPLWEVNRTGNWLLFDLFCAGREFRGGNPLPMTAERAKGQRHVFFVAPVAFSFSVYSSLALRTADTSASYLPQFQISRLMKLSDEDLGKLSTVRCKVTLKPRRE